MTLATVGFAAAANFPAPFVENSVADVAVVYGTGAGVSSLDMVQAGNIQTTLGESMPSSGGTTTTGGDSVLLERVSDKLNLGNSASDVFVTSVDSDDMPELLADGTYTDDVNTEYDYTQKITLGSNLGVEHFSDSDYEDKTPTIGIQLSDDEHVINYTIDFTTHPAYNATTLETTTLTLMGKEYYVLDVKGVGDASVDNSTTLLDAATSTIITEGEVATVSGMTVNVEYISATAVKLSVNGEITNSLATGGTYKLSDGTYVGIKDIMYDARDGGISKVEISLGSGKLELFHGSNIELNDNTVQEIKSFMIQDSSYKLDKIVLQWTTDDEAFIASESDLTMPGFEAVKFSMGDFYTSLTEETTLEASGNDVIELKTTIRDGEVTIPLLKGNSTGEFELIGKDSTNRLVTSTTLFNSATDGVLFFNETAGDKYIVASWNSSTEAESFYLKLQMITENSVNKVRFTNVVTGDTKVVTNASDASYDSVSITVNNVTRDGSAKWANISINSGGNFQTLYTEGGLKVFLPYYATALTDTGDGVLNYSNATIANATGVFHSAWPFVASGIYNGSVVSTAGHGHDSFYMYFDEEDKDSNVAGGNKFNATLEESGTSNKMHVSAIGVNYDADSGYEVDDTDNFENYITSDLATSTLYKTGGDQDSVVITYHGDQAYAELYLTSPEATVAAGSTLGDVLVKDSEVDSVKTKNLIVVGGSCINTVAANLLGSACGPSFTTATTVGTGQFLIQSFGDAYTTGKIALLVAGYEVADTGNAATFLRTQDVDTTAGNKYVGTSATSAELIVA